MKSPYGDGEIASIYKHHLVQYNVILAFDAEELSKLLNLA
jgi:hypothetical protein